MPTIRLLVLITGSLRTFNASMCLGEVIVLPAAMDAWGHHIACHYAAGIEVLLRQPFADDVAVSHHPDQPVIFPDRNGSYVMLTHQFREVGDRCLRTNPINVQSRL